MPRSYLPKHRSYMNPKLTKPQDARQTTEIKKTEKKETTIIIKKRNAK